MIRLGIQETAPEAVLARSLPNPRQPTTLLVKAGSRLSAHHLKLLQRLGFRSLWIEREGTGALDEACPEPLLEAYRAVVEESRAAHQQAARGPLSPARVGRLGECIDAFFEALDPAAPYLLLDDIALGPHEAGFHAANVLHLGLRLARRLGMLDGEEGHPDPARVRQAGLGLLLHDIGKAPLPPGLLQKDSWDLSMQEMEEIRRHPEDGYRLLVESIEEPYAAMALRHHRFSDGSGYPRHFSHTITEMINDPAGEAWGALCALANAFDELTNRQEYLFLEAQEELQCARRSQFSPDLLRALEKDAGNFESGVPIEISSGHGAAVLHSEADLVFRPVVLLLTEKGGGPLAEKQRIALAMRGYPNLIVQRVATRPVEHLLPSGAMNWEEAE